MAEFPAPTEGILLTHFIVSDDVERSRRFYTDVLGGETIRAGEPSFVALANSWIIINVGGGPTEYKPTVTLETPSDPDRTSSFLNIRVADIQAIYAEWRARGAEFLTPPQDRGASPLRSEQLQSALAGSGCQAGELSSLYGISVVSSATSTIRRTLRPLLRIT
jgi:catechol 2,3-dioxygenase-like lactoylglutathione lyase family enzyme